jgi:hypothetical protein
VLGAEKSTCRPVDLIGAREGAMNGFLYRRTGLTVWLLMVLAGLLALALVLAPAAGPLRPREGYWPLFDLPAGIALTRAFYLPAVLR